VGGSGPGRPAIEGLAGQVVGFGPEATLRQGFTIVRDPAGRPLTSRAAAAGHRELEIQFHDGPLAVEYLDEGGGRPMADDREPELGRASFGANHRVLKETADWLARQ
jgi:hypothetical protein